MKVVVLWPRLVFGPYIRKRFGKLATALGGVYLLKYSVSARVIVVQQKVAGWKFFRRVALEFPLHKLCAGVDEAAQLRSEDSSVAGGDATGS
jgi:hypothetical protein